MTDTYTDDFYGVAEYLGRFPSEHEVVRTRHEIIQHAKGIHLARHSVGRTRETAISCMGGDGESVYPGEYRTGRVTGP